MKRTTSFYLATALWTVTLTCFLKSGPVCAQPTQAKSANSFVNSVGVNIRLEQYPYSSNFSGVETALGNADISHVRDGFASFYSFSTLCSKYNSLANLGIKLDYVSNPNDLQYGSGSTPSQQLVSVLNNIPNALEAVEGINEPDNISPTFTYGGYTTWWQSANAWQQVVWNAVKSSNYASLPILAPSIGNPTNIPQYSAIQYASIGSYCNTGNMHSYQGGEYPGTQVSGKNLVSYYIDNTQDESGGSTPIWATETGNWIGSSNPNGFWMQPVDLTTQEKYALRTYAYNYLLGIPRTYQFELMDEPYVSGSPEQNNFGLMYSNGSPKPAYTALKNLMNLLNDPGDTNVPGLLDFSLTGNTNNVDDILLESKSGVFYLLLWQETRSYNDNAGSDYGVGGYSDIPVTPEAVTVNFNSTINSAAEYQPSVSSSPITTYPNNLTSLTVSVPDDIVVLKLSYSSSPVANGEYTLAPLSVPGSRLEFPAGAQLGSQLQIDPAGPIAGQYWYFSNQGNGYYKVTLCYNSGVCLDTVNGSGSEGTAIQAWNDDGAPSQRWAVDSNSNGSFSLTPGCAAGENPSEWLDVANYNGTLAQLWAQDGLPDQQWTLYRQ